MIIYIFDIVSEGFNLLEYLTYPKVQNLILSNLKGISTYEFRSQSLGSLIIQSK